MQKVDELNKYIIGQVKTGKISKEKAFELLKELNQSTAVSVFDSVIDEIVQKISQLEGKPEISEVLKYITLEELFSKIKERNYAEKSADNSYPPIRCIEEMEYYPLSSAQKRLFIINEISDVGTSYNLSEVLMLERSLDKNQLEDVFKSFIQKHESLRTSFKIIDGEPVQIVHKTVDFKVNYIKSEEQNAKELIKDLIQPFDLSKAPLLRLSLIQLPDDKQLLLLDIHHIIADGSSLSILQKEIQLLLSGSDTPAPKIQYKDFAVWQKKLLESEAIKKQEKYWLSVFSGEIPVLNMPTDYPRPYEQSFDGDRLKFKAEKELTTKLKKLTAETGTTLYIVLMAAYNILLYKYTGQEDIVVGFPIAGRQHAGLENIIGMFVNTLALRNYPVGNKTFKEFLQEVKHNALKAYENQDYQFEELIDKLDIHRDLSRNPLYDTIFVLQNHVKSGEGNNQLFENKTSKFDITLEALEVKGELSFELEYCTRLFKEETIQRLSGHYINILKEITANPIIKLEEIDMLLEEEKQQILVDFNNTKAHYPKEKLLHEVFEEQAGRVPNNIAVMFEDKKLTYRELNEKSNQLARILRSKGVKPDSIVGIMAERSFEMLVGILGTLKAGGAYLPISPDYPRDRIEYMLDDSRTTILLTHKDFEKVLGYPVDTIRLDDPDIYACEGSNLEKVNTSSNLAYVIYTSGSTGKPKGTMIEHYSVINRLNWMNKKYPLGHCGTILQKTPFTFDVSVWELFWWSFDGASVCMLEPGGEKDPGAIVNAVKKYKITTLHFVPSMLSVFLQYVDETGSWDELSDLRQVFASGEALTLQQVKKFNELLNKNNGTKLINLYGPTEATVDVSYFDCPSDKEIEVVPIGKPIDNIRLYIVYRNNMLCPIGVNGELCIAGDGLARGYLNRRELTLEKFVQAPFNAGERIYRTGDLARWMPNGNIEFIGRIDHQVKIRGFRIELGEVENQLLKHELINEAAVIVKEDNGGNKYLCAYIACSNEITVAELKEYLSRNLPDYMIPSYFIILDKMPLSHNGKLDRKALPEPENIIKTGAEFEAPTNITEEKLISIWQETLGLEGIGLNHNFFDIGGHSLKAAVLVSKIHKELNVEVPLGEVFKKPTVKVLAQYIQKAGKSKFSEILPVVEREYYPASSAQKRLYILDQLEGTDIVYNMPGTAAIDGEVDITKLKKALSQMVQRHEALRTSFEMIDEEIVQRVQEDAVLEITYTEAEEEQLGNILSGFVRRFNLGEAPLLRVGLVKTAEKKFVLLVDMHHIISDGISIGIFIREIKDLYYGKVLPPLQIQYKDFTEWQNALFQSDYIKPREKYWLDTFAGEIPVLNMPTDYPRPSEQSFEGNNITFISDKELAGKLNAMAREAGATMFMVLLAAYNVLLSRYAGQEDIVIGSPVAGRSHPDLQGIIGVFVNTLVFRNFPDRNKKFNEFLHEVKQNALKAYENQDYQFEELVNKLDIKRNLSRNPLFDAAFILQNHEGAEGIINSAFKNKISKFDITLEATETGGILSFRLEYCTRLFKEETIQRLSGHYINILKEITANPEVKLSEIDMLSEEEKSQILFEFNNTKAYYHKEKTIQEMIEDQVEKTPENIAVVFKDKQLTYKEMNIRANQLARVLREKGIKPDSIVGIMVERSIEMIIGIMGILKAGGAYLPISPEYPQDRVRFMLEDSCTGILLTHKGFAQNLDFQGDIINLDEAGLWNGDGSNLGRLNLPQSLAYVIYTSGSTGKPKGAMIEHYSVINRINWMHKKYPIDCSDTILQKTPFTFDVSVWELFWWSFVGARVCMLEPGGEKDPEVIAATIKNYNVTTMHFVPSMLGIFLQHLEETGGYERLTGLRQVFASGEALTLPQVYKFNKLLYQRNGTKLSNLYGPTEATVDVSYFDCSTGQEIEVVPIGKPIDNIKLYITDKDNNLCPVGVPGELCIAGDGLARGYLNRAELTAEKFTPNPFETGKKMYKTGDLTKWLNNGNIEFLGRIDHQVKIRGFRIELGEIESQLLKNGSIKEALVLSREDSQGNKYLCAYVVSEEEITITELREYLLRDLPDYMIPSYFVLLENMPLTVNGKVDRGALPEPGGVMNTGVEYVPPENPIEEKLVDIWRELLRVERIGVNDNFFEVGGHSLKAVALKARIAKEFNIDVTLDDIFREPRIKGLAKCIENGEYKGYLSVKPVEDREYYPVSFAQNKLVMLNSIENIETAFNMPGGILIEGNIDIKRVEDAFRELVNRHEALRTSFELRNGEPVQIIHKEVDFRLEYLESEDAPEDVFKKFVRVFDLTKAPLLRAGLSELSDKKHLLVYDMHHLISDGTSIAILIKEFLFLYYGQDLPEIKVRFRDFVEWQNKRIESNKLKKQEAYWTNVFKEGFPSVNMPLDFERGEKTRYRTNTLSLVIPGEAADKIKAFANKQNLTLNIVFFTLYEIILSKYSGQENIVVGTVVAGRNHEELENVIGEFSYALPVKMAIREQDELWDILQQAKKALIDVYDNQEYPFERIVNNQEIYKETMLNFHSEVEAKLNYEYGGVKFTGYEFRKNITNLDYRMDIFLNSAEINNTEIVCALEYNTSLFKEDTMQTFLKNFNSLIEGVLENPHKKISEINMP
ncbi:MAG: amino acid adenylation domain-containing protein [Clostridia bacterium]|nr:amino acid adenylation domain-containing protein [Clostridia bacterium]